MGLDALAAGDVGVIRTVGLERALQERLAALGLQAGRTVSVVRRSGRRGPLQLRLGATDLVLRASEAAQVTVIPAGRSAR